MSRDAPSPTALRVSGLSQGSKTAFDLRPDADVMAQIAQDLELTHLRKLRFEGHVSPLDSRDWQLQARLGATVVQPCVVTLEPVTTRIDVDVSRQFVQDFETPDEPEAEMPDDDSVEPLGAWIDPGQVMREALALAVPDYPRADDAELGALVVTEPGKKAMTDDDAKPFAGLAALRDSLDDADG